jgi:hypothetical protein
MQQTVSLTVNGKPVSATVEGRTLLVQLLREILGVNRAAIFLKEPAGLFFGQKPGAGTSMSSRSRCAIGLPSGLIDHFELSFDAGIGGQLYRTGRILRRQGPEALASTEIQQEFELLGAEVAIPILDRETLIGMAVLDGRLTDSENRHLTHGQLGVAYAVRASIGRNL